MFFERRDVLLFRMTIKAREGDFEEGLVFGKGVLDHLKLTHSPRQIDKHSVRVESCRAEAYVLVISRFGVEPSQNFINVQEKSKFRVK